jgi:hypothetical protein
MMITVKSTQFNGLSGTYTLLQGICLAAQSSQPDTTKSTQTQIPFSASGTHTSTVLLAGIGGTSVEKPAITLTKITG